jgi:hypothetical protein
MPGTGLLFPLFTVHLYFSLSYRSIHFTVFTPFLLLYIFFTLRTTYSQSLPRTRLRVSVIYYYILILFFTHYHFTIIVDI